MNLLGRAKPPSFDRNMLPTFRPKCIENRLMEVQPPLLREYNWRDKIIMSATHPFPENNHFVVRTIVCFKH